MRKLLLVMLVLTVLVAVSPLEAKGRSQTFNAPRERVWTVALAFIAQNYTLNNANQVEGTISFRGGTQEASLLIVGTSDIETLVTVNSKAAHAGLSWGMGIDSNKLQKKVLKGITDGLTPAPTPQAR